jgi:hypothetical protein
MSAGFAVEGGIDIAVTAGGGRIVDVAIANHRPLGLASHLVGFTPEAAVGRLVTLLSVCRIAQGLAGCMAVEQAMGIDPGPSQQAARSLLLRGEIALDHATSALLVWPGLVGKRPTAFNPMKSLRASLADLPVCLYPDGDWMRPGGGRLAPESAELTTRLDMAEAAIEEARLVLPLDPACWQDCVCNCTGPAAELFHLLKQKGLEGFGATNVEMLGTLDPIALARLLAADGAGSFAAQPDWEGEPRETGPLARQISNLLVAAIVAEHGRGLAAHFLAQCVETTLCLVEMRHLAQKIREDTNMPILDVNGIGLGLVEAARGWLAHRVEIADGHIRRYQILAPTEWNFHPHGALVRGLIGNSFGQADQYLARLLVTALDPCVPYRIELRNRP